MYGDDGAYLRGVQAALLTPACAHIKALFWDYASLFQHPPGGRRTAGQDAAFQRGLSVMAYMYASILGCTVLRHEAIPDGQAAVHEAKPVGAHGAKKCREVIQRWREFSRPP